MAHIPIDQKILGRLAVQAASTDEWLESYWYQISGLSIMLAPRVSKARRLRKLDVTRDTPSLQLYHHIIWMAREGLTILEEHILPRCEKGEHGAENRVMAAKLRASFYYLFCLFHNHPPVNQLSPPSARSGRSPLSVLSPTAHNGQARDSPSKSPKGGKENGRSSRRAGKAPLRDPIPSMGSETSYITNPYAPGLAQTPPPAKPPPPIPSGVRRSPMPPPGLAPINVSAPQAAASFLMPPQNFVPKARELFETAQHLANTLLPPSNRVRLSLTLEHAAFLCDCARDPDEGRRLSRRTIKEVYASSEGLDDDEYVDAAWLVQMLGGIVRRGTTEPTPRPSRESLVSPTQRPSRTPPIDRTISVSPAQKRSRTESPSQIRSLMRTPERLSTVPEVESTDMSGDGQNRSVFSPPTSRSSNRSRQRRRSSSTSEKVAKRRAVEQAEQEVYRRRSASNPNNVSGGGSHHTSRQSTPQEGISKTPKKLRSHSPDRKSKSSDRRSKSSDRKSMSSSSKSKSRSKSPSPGSKSPKRPSPVSKSPKRQRSISPSKDPAPDGAPPTKRASTSGAHTQDRRDAIRRTLDIITAVSKGVSGREKRHSNASRPWRIV